MPISDLYNFTEKRFATFNHSMRIYIAGSEVSQWLSGSVSITYAGRDGYNTASFDLQNPRKVWQLTRENLAGLGTNKGKFRITKDFLSEAVKLEIFNAKQNTEANAYYNLDTTQSVLGMNKSGKAKNFSANGVINSSGAFYENPYFPPDTYEERKYRLAVNDCIFNKHDWVRIFKKNPFSSRSDEWVEIFCGFIQEHPITTDFITGNSTVRISCSCIKQQLAKMRVQTNIHITDTDPQPLFDKGFYADFISPTLLTHPFANQSLQDAIANLILGSPVSKAVADSSLEELKRRVGYFNLGNVICYDPSSPGNTLERWHLMSMFGVNKVPYPKGGGVDDLWLTPQEMDKLGKATSPSSPYAKTIGGPTARYLHFLMPLSGTGPGNLTTYDMMTGSGSEARDWTTRWECIRDLASKLDFQVLTSPSGDILVEFPQYGFTPCAYLTNFGSTSSTTSDAVQTAKQEAVKSLSNPLSKSSKPKSNRKSFPQCDKTENSIGNLFTFYLHQKEETLNDEAEDFPTILQVGGGFAFNPLNDTTNGSLETFSPRAFVYSPALVDRYGVIAGQADFPFAGQNANEIEQNGSNTSITQRLAQLGLIEFTKRMADASMWSGSVIYRPFLFPNRPIHLKKSARIGLIQSVTYNWTIAQSAGVQIACNMIMAERHDGSYRLLTGSVNTPIDYGAVWGSPETTAGNLNKVSGPGKDKAVPQAANSGVYVETGSAKDAKKEVQDKQSTADPKKAVEKLTANSRMDLLYPPFRKMVEELLAACLAKNIKVSLASTYRTPAEQDDLRKKNLAKKLPAAEAFQSLHVYGLAVDFKIEGASGLNDPKYALIDNENVVSTYSSGDTLAWGGNFSNKDGVHFQIPYSWGMLGTRAEQIANRYRGKLEELECVKKVWACLNALNPALVKNEVSPADQNVLDEIKNSFGVNYFTSPVGPYTAAHIGEFRPPVPCKEQLLKTAGLQRKSI